MKIIHIIPSLNKGGAEKLVLDICIELQKSNEVCLVTFSKKNKYQALSNLTNHKVIPSYSIPSITGVDKVDVDNLQNFVNDFMPDIIHTHLWEAEIVARQITCEKAKWFSHFHDNIPQLNKIKIPVSKKEITNLYERKLMLKKYRTINNNFICISKHTLNYAQEVLTKEFSKRTTLLFNAINLDSFQASAPPKMDKIRLINIGSFVSKKNQRLAIDTVIHLNKIGVDTEITFLGEGITKQKLEKYVSDNSMANKVHFKGNVNNVSSYLNRANIYLHTATYEPFGLVLLEAMACKLPIVCIDGGGNNDIIKNKVTGFILSKNTTEKDLGEQIIALFNDQKLYNSIVTNGHKLVKQFDIKNYCTKLLAIYKSDT